MIVVLIVIPFVPVFLATLVIMIVMLFVNMSKHKSLFQTIGIIMVMVTTMSISIFMSNNASSQQDLLIVLNKVNGLAQSLYPYFPTLKFASEALINTSCVSLFLLILISAVSYVVMILVSNKIYFKGVVGSSSTGSYSKKKADKKTLLKEA